MCRGFIITAFAAILAWGAPGHAQDQGGFYVGGALGMVVGGETRNNGNIKSTGTVLDGVALGTKKSSTKGGFDTSLSTNATIGYEMGKLRFEGELFYQDADTDQLKGLIDGSAINPPAQVNATLLGVAANVAYNIGEFNIGDFGALRPYVTLGVGQANVEAEYVFPTRGRVRVDGNSIVYQGGFGVDMSYNERTTFDLKYRFRRVGINEKGIDGDFDSYILEAGLRYRF